MGQSYLKSGDQHCPLKNGGYCMALQQKLSKTPISFSRWQVLIFGKQFWLLVSTHNLHLHSMFFSGPSWLSSLLKKGSVRGCLSKVETPPTRLQELLSTLTSLALNGMNVHFKRACYVEYSSFFSFPMTFLQTKCMLLHTWMPITISLACHEVADGLGKGWKLTGWIGFNTSQAVPFLFSFPIPGFA